MRRTKTVAVAIAVAAATFSLAPIGSADAACSVGSYLTQGKRGSDQVRCLQQTLNEGGYNSGPVDGYFGPVTRRAVVSYQSAKGLVVDGVVGPQTAGSLGVWTAAAAQPQAARQQRSSGGAGTLSNEGRWDRIARCESGGNWSYPPVTNRTGTYSGGLMIGHRWWGPNGGRQYAEWPYLATKAQQIAVAETIWAANGPSAWDCA